jgi:signal transduction histidine kinase
MGKMRLLLLEDVTSDVELITHTLKRSGMEFNMVVTQNNMEFINALDKQAYDVILADNNLPQFSAAEALMIINRKKIDIPFILVTGSISEEYAVEMMKKGTWDYILKDRLQRLPNAVLSAFHKYRLAAQNSKYVEEVIANEALLKEASRLAHFGSWEMDMINNRERWSDEQYRILGYEPGEVEPTIDNFFNRVHPDDLKIVRDALDSTLRHAERQRFECRIVNSDDSVKHISAEMLATHGDKGKLLRINGFMQDVSPAKNAELKEKKVTADLMQRNKDLEQFAYIISHNLRGPVANIVGISEALFDKSLDNAEKDSFMEALSTSIKRLDSTIIDLNHIIQVKHHVNENKEYVDFSQIVDEVISGFGDVLNKKRILVNCDFSVVSGMSTLKSYLQSIFYNLIYNSIKFRQKNLATVIEIKSSLFDEKIVLSFKDNGIGIDLDRRSNHIFGLYKRFHPDYAEGKGMGLFMVKTQAEALGGKINVRSKVNEGTEFTIEFEQLISTQ